MQIKYIHFIPNPYLYVPNPVETRTTKLPPYLDTIRSFII